MTNRNLFLGFGAGLVFAAGFMIVFPPQGSSSVLTKEQLQAAAQAYNMMLIPKQEYDELQEKKQQENEAKAPKAPAQPASPTAIAPGAGQAPVEPKAPAAGGRPTMPAAPANQAPAAAKEKISFQVTPGMTSATVSSQLVKAGILPADNQLIRKLRDQKKLNRIRTGTYLIEKGISEEDLIKLLTTPPRN